jgi:hypothetical protein
VKHFSDAAWADFARNVIPAASRQAMQRHIDEGCEKCTASVAIWQGVKAITSQESMYTPPADLVRVVKSQMTALTPQTSMSKGIRMLFDSMLQPLTAGVRGSVAARQFLYETDDYYIDLRLEPRDPQEHSCVVGQVLNRSGQERAAQGVAIYLREGKQPIAQTATNQFGEFQLEFDATGEICISISRGQHDEIILPLYGVHAKPVQAKDLD